MKPLTGNWVKVEEPVAQPALKPLAGNWVKDAAAQGLAGLWQGQAPPMSDSQLQPQSSIGSTNAVITTTPEYDRMRREEAQQAYNLQLLEQMPQQGGGLAQWWERKRIEDEQRAIVGAPRTVGQTFRDLAAAPTQFMPFVGDAPQKAREWHANREVAELGENASPDAWRVVLEAQQRAGQRQAERDQDIDLPGVIDIASNIPTFVTEMASAPGRAAFKGGAIVAGKLLGSGAAKGTAPYIARRGVQALAGSAAMAAGPGAARSVGSALDRNAPQLGVTGADTPKGIQLDYGVVPGGEGEGIGEALLRGVADQTIEYYSERFGDALKYLPRMKGLDAGKKKIVAAFAGKFPDSPLAKLLRAGQFHGIPAEMFEEEAGKVLRWAVGNEDYNITTPQELRQQAAAFAIPGGAVMAANAPGFAVDTVNQRINTLVSRMDADQNAPRADGLPAWTDNARRQGWKVEADPEGRGWLLTNQAGTPMLLTGDADLAGADPHKHPKEFLESFITEPQWQQQMPDLVVMAQAAVASGDQGAMQVAVQEALNAGVPVSGMTITFADGGAVPFNSLVFLADPNADAGNFDHESAHAALPFFTNGREYRALGRRYGTDENGRIAGEEDLVQDMLRVIRQNRAIENYATAPERILWKVGQRIRSFTSMVTGKDFKQIAEELRTGRLQDRGVVTDSAEQVRRGARMTLPGQPAVPAGPAPTETGNADAQGGVPVPGTPVEPGSTGGPEGPGGGVAPVAGTAQAQPPAAPAPQTFLTASDGGESFGDLEAGERTGPVRYSGQDITPGQTQQIESAGYPDAATLIEDVTQNRTAVYPGQNGRVQMVKPLDGGKNVAVVDAVPDGDGWRATRGYIAPASLFAKRRPLGAPQSATAAPEAAPASTQPQPENAPPRAAQAAEWQAVTPRENVTVGGKWRVAEADDLVTSDMDGYDQSLQQRNRDTITSQAQIESIAANPNPMLLLDNPSTDGGAPIIDGQGRVISGNGRTMGLRRAYESDTAEAYRQAVIREAQARGLGDASVMRRPVLVREMTDTGGATLKRVADLSNQAKILQMTPAEQAQADADVVDGIVDLFKPDEAGNIRSASNADFLAQFVQGTGADNLIQSDGSFSPEIDGRVHRAILASVFRRSESGRRAVQEVFENAEEFGIRKVLTGISQSAGRLLKLSNERPGLDLAPALGEALRDYANHKKEMAAGRVKSLDETLAQRDMFDERAQIVEILMREMDTRGAKSAAALKALLDRYARLAQNVADPNTASLFGEEVPDTRPMEILENARRELAEEEGTGGQRSLPGADAGNRVRQAARAKPDAPDAGQGRGPDAQGEVGGRFSTKEPPKRLYGAELERALDAANTTQDGVYDPLTAAQRDLVRKQHEDAWRERDAYLAALREVADATGLEYDPSMEPYAVKDIPGIAKKVRKDGERGATDALRYTLVLPLDSAPDAGKHGARTVRELRRRGYTVLKGKDGKRDVDNSFAAEKGEYGSGYRDFAIKVTKNGEVMELQLLQRNMLDKKFGEGHDLYDGAQGLKKAIARGGESVKRLRAKLYRTNRRMQKIYTAAFWADNPRLNSERMAQYAPNSAISSLESNAPERNAASSEENTAAFNPRATASSKDSPDSLSESSNSAGSTFMSRTSNPSVPQGDGGVNTKDSGPRYSTAAQAVEIYGTPERALRAHMNQLAVVRREGRIVDDGAIRMLADLSRQVGDVEFRKEARRFMFDTAREGRERAAEFKGMAGRETGDLFAGEQGGLFSTAPISREPSGQKYNPITADEGGAKKTQLKVARHFGATNDPREAGYVMPNGRMLDLSGKRQGEQGGVRYMDHRELPDLGGESGTDNMLAAKNAGLARVDFNLGMVNITVPLTPKQASAIVAGMESGRPSGIVVELDDPASHKTVYSAEMDGDDLPALRRTLNEANAVARGERAGEFVRFSTARLAPNGNPSNLNAHQWAQVRTPAFKRWGGDWEAWGHRQFLEGEPVARLTGEEVPRFEKLVDLARWVGDWFQREQGGKATHPALGDVVLDQRSARASIGHGMSREKGMAFAAVPQIISRGRILLEGEKDGRAGVFLGAPISITGKDYVAIALVRKAAESNRFYLHEVVLKERLQNASKSQTAENRLSSAANSGAIRSILEDLFSVKPPSVLLDENGEPKVVYHGTDSKFYKVNFRKGAQGLFWFAGDKESIISGESGAQGTKNIMELYVKAGKQAGWNEYDKYSTDELHGRGYDSVILPENDGTFVGFVFNSPTQIKSATGNTGAFDPDNPDIRYSTAGAKSLRNLPPKERKVARENLRMAQRMMESASGAAEAKAFLRSKGDGPENDYGFSDQRDYRVVAASKGWKPQSVIERDDDVNERIRLATGWYQGLDGKWKYEVDDSEMDLNYYAIADDASLSNVIIHPKLQRLYPRLFNEIEVDFHEEPEEGEVFRYYGSYDPENKVIHVYGDSSDIRSTILHELQHAIQYEEGFGSGFTDGPVTSENRKRYARSAGEMEARDTQYRADLTPEERRARPPMTDVRERDGLGPEDADVRFSTAQPEKLRVMVEAREGAQHYLNHLEKAYSGNLPRGAMLNLGNTPKVLQYLGAGRFPLKMRADKLVDIRDHHPEITLDMLRQIPEEIHVPVLVVQSSAESTFPEGLVVLTEMHGLDGSPVIAAIHMDVQDRNSTINRLASVYGKREKDKIQGWINRGLLYWDKERAPEVLRTLELQLLVGEELQPPNESIPSDTDIFKPESGSRYSTAPPPGSNIPQTTWTRYRIAAFTAAMVHKQDRAAYRQAMLDQHGPAVEPYLDGLADDYDKAYAAAVQRAQQAAKTKVPGGIGGARPDLGRVGSTTKAWNDMKRVDATRENPERGQADWERQADEWLAATPEPEAIAAIRAKAENGESLTAGETKAAHRLYDILHDRWLQSNDPADRQAALEFAAAYRDTGSTVSDEMNARKIPTTPSGIAHWLMEHLTSPSRALDRRIEAVRAVSRDKTQTTARRAAAKAKLAGLLQLQGRQVEKRIAWMRKRGWDLSQSGLENIAGDEGLRNRFLRDVSTDRASAMDKAHEFRVAAMLSKPLTHQVNVVSSLAHFSWETTVQRAVEAAINLVARDKSGAQFGEFRHMLRAALSGDSWAHAASNAIQSALFETQVLARQVGGEHKIGAGMMDTNYGAAIKGVKGRVVRIPLTGLLVEDEFQRTLFARIEAAAHAYRIAKGEGLRGKALQDRMRDLVNEYSSDAWKAAAAAAERHMFQDKGGPVQQGLVRLRGIIPGGRWVIPFANTPMSLFRTAMRKSVFAPAALAKDFAMGAEGDTKLRHAAESVLALLVAAGLSLMFFGGDDDDDKYPRITGSNPPGVQRNQWSQEAYTIPPDNVRIGDEYRDYRRIEPFGSAVSALVTAIETFRRADSPEAAMKAAGKVFILFTRNFTSYPMLQGLDDVLSAMEAPESKGAQFVQNFLGSFSPNLVKGAVRDLDDTVRQRRGMSFWEGLQYAALPVGDTAQPKVDVWGGEVQKGGSFISRTVSPFRVTKKIDRDADTERLNQWIRAWNAQNPDEPYLPQPPGNTITENGIQYTLTPEQWTEYQRLAGKYAVEELARLRLTPNAPTEDELEDFKDALTRARRWARQDMLDKLTRTGP